MASWLVPLLVQVGLSLRLLWSNTAFLNEAQYLYAGHQELANKLRMLGYDTYFSGHPSLYPVLGALVDSIGGLTAARLLGLAFMLLATWLLYRMTTDMFGPVAGCAAALAFAAIAPTQFLSAFATYDPMAMAMLAVAAYCAHRATWTATRHDGALVLSFIALLIADFTKYAVVLYTPVVLAILLLNVARNGSWRRAIRLTIGYTFGWLVAGAFLVWASGPGLWHGITFTTFSRQHGTDSAGVVIGNSLAWIGVFTGLALLGVCAHIVLTRRRAEHRLISVLLGVFLFAATLATLNQARIDTLTSLHKHDAFGAWFAATAVGYLFATITGRRWRQAYRAALPVGLVAVLAVLGVRQSWQLYQHWPNSTPLVNAIRPLVHTGNEHYFAEEVDVVSYYLGDQVDRTQWRGPGNSTPTYRDANGRPLSKEQAWQRAIAQHYFKVIMFSYADYAKDVHLEHLMVRAGYRKVDVINYVDSHESGKYTIWEV